MRRLSRAEACSAVVLTAVLAGCGAGPTPDTGTPGNDAPSATSEPRPSVPTPAPSPSEPPRTVEHALTAFVAAARVADARLHEAALLVNGAVRREELVVDSSTVAAVAASDPAPVRDLIPAGMPTPLVRAALLVYSDLSSRHAAMSHVRSVGTYPLAPSEEERRLGVETEGARSIRCLSNGSEAATRFDGDLEALDTLASATLVAPVDPRSLAAADLAVRLSEIDLRNAGCDGCGGYRATGFATLTWDDAEDDATTRSGRLGGDVAFRATFEPGVGWVVQINAC